MTLPDHIIESVERLKEPLGLTGWTVKLEHGPLEDAKAANSSEPEYKHAVIAFDLTKLTTGDELDEIIVHEMMHSHTWPIFEEAENLIDLVLGFVPDAMRAPLKKYLDEKVRYAGEDANTQVGFVVIRLLRRLTEAQKELANARTEIKSLRKQAKQVDKAVKSD